MTVDKKNKLLWHVLIPEHQHILNNFIFLAMTCILRRIKSFEQVLQIYIYANT